MYAPLRAGVAEFSRFLLPSLSGVSVLCYHSIGHNAARSTISPEVFEQQIAFIASRYRVLAPSELVASLASREPMPGCVTITFDDGYEDNLKVALPILEKYKVHAGVFVITSLIGQSYTYSGGIDIPLMDRAQLYEAHTRGLEILSHTKTHRDMRDVPEDEFETEFEDSRRELESILSSPVPRITAFPKGRSNVRVRAWLRDHEWSAFGTEGGTVSPDSSSHDLARNSVRRDTTESEFKMMLSDGVLIFQRLRGLR